jgi:hypothetical protein
MHSVEHGFLGRRTLSFLIFIFVVSLGLVLLTSERGVSGVMERIGDFVAYLFGQ